jgi:GrpB-like predicted nucleotidyltransferase (UPF0157 family)
MMEPSHPRWESFVLFRDYLRVRPEVARAYADIKRELAAAVKDDIARYRNGKRDFVGNGKCPGLESAAASGHRLAAARAC